MFISPYAYRDEKDNINIDIIPHVSMGNRSSWNIPCNPIGDYDVPPDALRESTPTYNSDDSFDSDNELEVKNETPSNPKVLHDSKDNFDLMSASNSAVQPDRKEHIYKSKRSRMPLPNTPLQSSLHNSVISGPANGHITDEDIHDYEEMDEQLSSLSQHKKVDFGLPAIESPQKKSLAYSHPRSKKATQKDTQDNVQEDQLSDESEGYVIEQINFKSPVTGKKNKSSDESEGYVIEQIDFKLPVLTDKMHSSYLKLFATSNGTVKDGDGRSEYYEWCEVKQLQKLSPVAPVATTTTSCRSDAFVECSSIHEISQLHDRTIKASQCMESTGERTYDDTRRSTTEIKQSNISTLQRVDSTISDYVHMYRATNPATKKDLDTFTYDYVHHLSVQTCKHRRQCTGLPPRNIKRTECQPSIYINMKEHKTYVNFEIIENHTISLPPRGNCGRPMPKQRTNHKPQMPPRTIPRPGCYLSAPSAVLYD